MPQGGGQQTENGEKGTHMQFGFHLPNLGPELSADTVVRMAWRAEVFGFDSVWVVERILWPRQPSVPYPGSDDGSVPESFQKVFEPLSLLAWLAPQMQRARLGTSIVVTGERQPAVLAKTAATVDVLSKGRLILGLGVGWNAEELQAAGVDYESRGRRMDEVLKLLALLWTGEVVSFRGEFYSVNEVMCAPAPVQKPYPELWMGGFAMAAARRAGTWGRAWHPSMRLPEPALRKGIEVMRRAAEAAGRDPGGVMLAPRVALHVGKEEGPHRQRFNGSPAQIVEDCQYMRRLGVTYAMLDFNLPYQYPIGEQQEMLEMLGHEVLPLAKEL